jgi:16S rRNA (uracil1498-N3)-methyltransferase
LRLAEAVSLPRPASQHVLRVLRLKPGAVLIIFNGQGGEYAARLAHIEQGTTAVLSLEEFIARDVESPLVITLALGISRGERMDYALQKAVELGVTHIVPLLTQFCVVNIVKEREEKRLSHWRGIIIAACEQSGRTRLPDIVAPRPFHPWLAEAQASLKLLFDPYTERRLADVPKPDADVCVLIGPEGGLSEAEAIASQQAGFIAVRLGPRMLRTETAPVAALSALQCLWGDFH